MGKDCYCKKCKSKKQKKNQHEYVSKQTTGLGGGCTAYKNSPVTDPNSYDCLPGLVCSDTQGYVTPRNPGVTGSWCQEPRPTGNLCKADAECASGNCFLDGDDSRCIVFYDNSQFNNTSPPTGFPAGSWYISCAQCGFDGETLACGEKFTSCNPDNGNCGCQYQEDGVISYSSTSVKVSDIKNSNVQNCPGSDIFSDSADLKNLPQGGSC